MDPVTSGGMGLSYPDSVDSSPRSRGGESWDEPFPSAKLRLMCSYGGRIVPRPTDKSLCYLGGDTRIVVVDRHSSLSDLSAKLSRSLLNNRPFTLKYQLPNEDLDSLISVTTDDDLDNMVDEYDRIAAGAAAADKASAKSSRIRLFLFPSKPDSAPSSIGSLLDDSKSETWFVDALNGAMAIGIDGLPRGLSTDSASVNCLLGLNDDDSSVHSRSGIGAGSNAAVGGQADPDQIALSRPDKLARQGQDVHSVPDSPMLETNSSFGSTSSLSHLPPIRVRPDDRPPDQRYANLDDHFQQMNLSSAAAPPPSVPPPPISAALNPTISPTDNPNRGFASEDDKPDTRSQMPVPPQTMNQQKPAPIEAPVQDSRPVYYKERMPTAAPPVNQIADPKRDIPMMDPSGMYQMQQVPVPESGYLMPTITSPEQQQQQQLHPLAHPNLLQQQQPPQQQQFIHAQNHHFVPMPSYYHVPHPMQQSQPFDPSIPMYYLPVRHNPQPQAVPMPKVAPKPDIQPNLYRTMASPAPIVHVAHTPPPNQGHAAYTGTNYQYMMHQHHPSQAPPATTVVTAAAPQMANYGYANAAPASAADTVHAQVYYTQATSPPSMQAQYQTMISADGQQLQQAAEMKQNRAS